MANPILAQIIQGALRSRTSPAGGGFGAGPLGGVLGGILGNRTRAPSGNRTVLLAMMLPLVMRWVQRNGGLGAVLERFRQHGLGQQADSWVSTRQNQGVSPQDVKRVVGSGEIASLASRLGVPEDEAAHAFSEILPEVANQLTPQGHVPPHADQELAHGSDALSQALGELHADTQQLP